MFDRIQCNPEILGGKPCVKGTRISVEFILELLASGGSVQTICEKYPHLQPEDVEQAIQYASHFLENEVLLTQADVT
jgi:uncharacterized protein (DUF433 family)